MYKGPLFEILWCSWERSFILEWIFETSIFRKLSKYISEYLPQNLPDTRFIYE